MTRAEAIEAFNHVLDTVLDRGDSSSLKRSLIQDVITDIFDLITITDDVIDSLTYNIKQNHCNNKTINQQWR
jgi:hypothetical protein